MTEPRLRFDQVLPASSETNSDSAVTRPDALGKGWHRPQSSTPSAVVAMVRKASCAQGSLIARHVNPWSVVISRTACVGLDSRTPVLNATASSGEKPTGSLNAGDHV